MYPQGVCRIRKPAHAGNGCAIFPVFDTEEWAEKIRSQSQTIYSEVPKEYATGGCYLCQKTSLLAGNSR